MASQYELKLRATLDTSDVKNKLDQLHQNGQGTVPGGPGGSGGPSVNSLNERAGKLIGSIIAREIGQSLSKFEAARGNNVAAKTIQGGFNVLQAGLMGAALGPQFAAITAGLAAFGEALGIVTEKSKAEADALDTLVKKMVAVEGREDRWSADKSLKSQIDRGNAGGLLVTYKQRMKQIQARIDDAFFTNDAGTLQLKQQRTTEEQEELTENVRKWQDERDELSKTIDKLKKVLEDAAHAEIEDLKARQKEDKEQEAADKRYDEARVGFKVSEADYQASRRGDFKYFKDQFERSLFDIKDAKDLDSFTKATSQLRSARTQGLSILDTSYDSELKSLETLLTPMKALSNLAAMGGNMGENDYTVDDISDKVGQVVSKLQAILTNMQSLNRPTTQGVISL